MNFYDGYEFLLETFNDFRDMVDVKRNLSNVNSFCNSRKWLLIFALFSQVYWKWCEMSVCIPFWMKRKEKNDQKESTMDDSKITKFVFAVKKTIFFSYTLQFDIFIYISCLLIGWSLKVWYAYWILWCATNESCEHDSITWLMFYDFWNVKFPEIFGEFKNA